MSDHTEEITLVFDLIRRYAEQQGWIPIGWRVFEVGPWTVTVNGTPDACDHIPPYHAMIAHAEVVSFMLVHPFGGTIGGWQGAEDAFIREMEAALKVTADRGGPAPEPRG